MVERRAIIYLMVKKGLVIGKGKDMQFRPEIWEKWNSDASDRDQWKHGRVTSLYQKNYDKIKWEPNRLKGPRGHAKGGPKGNQRSPDLKGDSKRR